MRQPYLLAVPLACLLAVPGLGSAQLTTEPVPVVGAPAKLFADVPTTHEKIGEVSVTSSDGKNKLQTVSIDSEGRIIALAAPPKSFGPPVKGAMAEVKIFTPEGKLLTTIKLDWHANAVAGGPDGHVYVAGEGKVFKFNVEGKQLAEFELPFVAEALADKDGPRKAAEEMVKRSQESMEKVVASYKERLKILEAKKEEDRTALEKKQLEQFKQILKSYEPRLEGKNEALIEQYINQITGRLKTINALTFSAKDAFVVSGSTKGFGYGIWRLDHNFKDAKLVLPEVRGCCGQMDIHCSGEDLLVAENTSHRFARYDRDGKMIGAWGKRAGAVREVECFGGCCNPMNIRSTSAGDIFTAESEGVIKRFSPKGDFLGVVATVPLTGAGCKNVAFAVSRDESKVYFLDLNGSRFLILGRKTASK